MLVLAPGASATFSIEPGAVTVNGDPLDVIAADFNGDSRSDVAVVGGTSSKATILLRQAGGGFAEEAGSPINVASAPSPGGTGDFNDDGRPDLVIPGFISGGVTVLLRNPGGGFTAEAPIADGPRLGGLVVSNFNGQGPPDLALLGWDAAIVTVQVRGPAGFTAEPGAAFTGGANPRDAASADFNGDGITDLAVANAGSASVAVLLRQAGGGFLAESAAVPVGASPFGIVAADFNADGAPDVATANYGAGTVDVLMRQAAGFATPASINLGGTPSGVTSADFNLDGRADLAVAGGNTGEIHVLLSTATGFRPDPSSPIPLGGNPNGIAAADFNADGAPDLGVINGAEGRFTSLLNTTDRTAPETTITKGPKKKTAKRKAKLKFKASEPDSTFECKLDKKPFAPCKSPFKKKVKDGTKHRFQVRATDPAGNVEATPAKRKWKVLKG
jgi:hypothetical protein